MWREGDKGLYLQVYWVCVDSGGHAVLMDNKLSVKNVIGDGVTGKQMKYGMQLRMIVKGMQQQWRRVRPLYPPV